RTIVPGRSGPDRLLRDTASRVGNRPVGVGHRLRHRRPACRLGAGALACESVGGHRFAQCKVLILLGSERVLQFFDALFLLFDQALLLRDFAAHRAQLLGLLIKLLAYRRGQRPYIVRGRVIGLCGAGRGGTGNQHQSCKTHKAGSAPSGFARSCSHRSLQTRPVAAIHGPRELIKPCCSELATFIKVNWLRFLTVVLSVVNAWICWLSKVFWITIAPVARLNEAGSTKLSGPLRVRVTPLA